MRRGGILIAVALILFWAVAAIAALAQSPEKDPVVEKWLGWPYQTTCGGPPFNPLEAFSGPVGVERGDSPSERALGEFLKKERWTREYVPAHDWRLLVETDSIAEFASGRLGGAQGPGTMSFELVDGRWKWSGLSSGCRPASIVDGHTAISWALVPGQRLSPSTRTVRVNLSGGPCDGGRSLNAHAHPVFQQIGKNLLMSVWLDPPPPGGGTCVGIVEPPRKFKLPEALGDRILFEAGAFPPRRAGQTRER
jgi:hypothetical protein